MNYFYKDKGIRYINSLLHEKIRDFYVYNKLIKQKTGICRNIPIYVDDSNIFLPLKSFKAYDCIWINYANIKSVNFEKNKAIIVFCDGEIKYFEIGKKKLERIIKDAKIVIDYFNNH